MPRNEENVYYLPGSASSVYIKPAAAAPPVWGKGTPIPIRKLATLLDVAPWGEDNRFPQNIEQQLSYCGIAKAGLDHKARKLWGQGIIPVKVIGYEGDGSTEIVTPLDRNEYANIYSFIEDRRFYRFYVEFLQDWVWYGNCFAELVLSMDRKSITSMVHQESCDMRFRQMDDTGVLDTVFLSKLWGMTADQFVKFDPEKRLASIINTGTFLLTEVDGKFIKQLRALDMYDALNDLKNYAATLEQSEAMESVILPVNYPSPNKTYYQLPSWDAARLAGWIQIAIKIPSLIVSLYNNAFHIKYHIEIPEEYFEKRVGTVNWTNMTLDQRKAEKQAVLNTMDDFLKGTDKAGSAFISYFDYNRNENQEYNRIKITALGNNTTIDKELLVSAGANNEILYAMGLNPDTLGAGQPGGAYGGNKGGSNIREGSIVYDSTLNLERQIILEPLYLVRDFNQWGNDIVFRFRDTVLTTLDQNTGSVKKIS